MFGIRPGTYYLSSETDTRWCVSEHVEAMSIIESEWFANKIKELSEKFGSPPDDLRGGCMKD